MKGVWRGFGPTDYTRGDSLWDPVVWVNPAQPPSMSRCAPHSRSPVFPDRPSKILLLQVGTLSSSHPSFGLSVFFFLSARHPSLGCLFSSCLSVCYLPTSSSSSLASNSHSLRGWLKRMERGVRICGSPKGGTWSRGSVAYFRELSVYHVVWNLRAEELQETNAIKAVDEGWVA